jgi:hypothetical protein
MLSQINKPQQYKYHDLVTNAAKYLFRINQPDRSISIKVIIIC